MNDKKRIAVPMAETMPAITIPANDPMAMMMQAKQAGFEMSEIKEMMDLQDRNDKRVAKQAFDKAMSDFKRDPPRVIKDKENTQYNSMYATIGNVVNTVNEAMGPHGLNARWEFPTPTDTNILCTCVLAHALGHEERVTLDAPLDDSGKKNALQQRRSTRTYLRLETFEAVTGIASEYNQDDDGNGSNDPVDLITEEKAFIIHALITDNGLNMETFMNLLAIQLKVSAIEYIPADRYDDVIKKIERTIKAQP